METFLSAIYKEGQAFSWLETTAVFLAIVYVVLAGRGNRWCFLFGLISSTIYVYFSFIVNFYFDTLINAYYVIMSFVGWYAWSENKRKRAGEKTYTHLESKKFFLLSVGGILLSLITAYLSDRYTNASLPYLDALTTVFSIIATWLVIKRIIENWLLWIAVDSIASFMYFYKGLYLTSILFITYTIIAIIGYFQWKKEINQSLKLH